MPLFGAEPLLLLDDPQGGIRYWPRAVPPAFADALFACLRDRIEWKGERRPMYERIVEVPRLQASVALGRPGDRAGLHQLEVAARHVRALAPAPYTDAGLNFYRDGRDGVAMHNDRTHDLVEAMPIAILSLGEPRAMLIRRKEAGARALRILLEPGSLLVMSHASQATHEHGIPKTAMAVGPRISCAFRARKPPKSKKGPG